MHHLNLEDLARLVDEAPEPGEAAHLRDCFVCQRELREMRTQTAALAALPADAPPARAWRELEAVLLQEALIRPGVSRRAWFSHPGVRAAAALVLFLLGGVAGAALWGGGGAGGLATGADPVDPAGDRRIAAVPDVPPVVVVTSPEEVRGGMAREAAGAGVRLASSTRADPQPRRPAATPAPAADRGRPAEAAARVMVELAEAQAAYVAALQRYAALADESSGLDPQTRLAALEHLVDLTREGLERVPGDPVINGYLMAATAERDALRGRLLAAANTTWF
jgi:hypothetical protein